MTFIRKGGWGTGGWLCVPFSIGFVSHLALSRWSRARGWRRSKGVGSPCHGTPCPFLRQDCWCNAIASWSVEQHEAGAQSPGLLYVLVLQPALHAGKPDALHTLCCRPSLKPLPRPGATKTTPSLGRPTLQPRRQWPRLFPAQVRVPALRYSSSLVLQQAATRGWLPRAPLAGPVKKPGRTSIGRLGHLGRVHP